MRSKYKTRFFICLTLGILGAHKFQEKKVGLGILYIFTLGLFGIGWICDCIILFKLAFLTDEESLVRRSSREKEIYEIKKEKQKAEYDLYLKEKEERKNRKEVCCPKCGSTSLTANKKGWSLGKGLAGAAVINPIGGVVTGMIGKNKIIITCLKCGKKFKPGH